MAQPKPPPESPASGAESDPPDGMMERFKSLTKGLLGVPLDKVKEAERRQKTRRSGPAG